MALRGRNAPPPRSEMICMASSLPAETVIVRPTQTSPLARRRSPASLSPTPALKPLDSYSLFKYFSTAVLPRFQVLDEHIPVELHIVKKDEPLQQAILAIARAHHSFLSKCNLGGTAMIRSKARLAAINGFRKQLECGVVSDNAAQDLFTINVLLCMLDGMIEPERDLNASMFHLKGGYAMLNRWPSTVSNMLQENGFRAHLLSVFVTMDLVHAFLSGDKPYFDSSIWKMFDGIQAWWGRLQKTNMFLKMLNAHSQMAVLGYILKTGCESSGSLFGQHLPVVESLLSAPVDCGKTEWEAFCHFYLISGSIYFHRVLKQRSIEDEIVQDITRRGVSLLVETVLPGMMSHCVVLPMLVIGSHCITDHDRQVVREALSPSLHYLSFGNMPVMADFLRATWKKHDMNASWFELFHDVCRTCMFTVKGGQADISTSRLQTGSSCSDSRG